MENIYNLGIDDEEENLENYDLPTMPIVFESAKSAPKVAAPQPSLVDAEKSREDEFFKNYFLKQQREQESLNAAEDTATDNRFLARLGGAFNTVGQGLAGQNPNNSAFDAMVKDAGAPVEAFERSNKLSKSGDKVLSDYFSQKSKQAAALEQKGRTDRRQEETERHNKAIEDLLRSSKGTAQQEKVRNRVNQDVQELSNRLDKAGLGELDSIAREVEANINIDANDDIPGVGQTAALPDMMISKKGTDVRQAVGALRNIVLKARSGGSVTPQESTRMMEELGTGATRSDAQLRQGIKNVLNQLNSKKTNILAGYDDGTRGEFVKRGGSVDPIGRSPKTSGPKPGDEMDGYRFKGGNPADKNNWEKI